MEKVADVLARYVLSKQTVKTSGYDVFKYGFQVGLEALICLAVSMGIAIYIHMFLEFFILLGVFVILRSYGGGLHLNSYKSCFLCSCSVMVGILLFIKYVSIQRRVAWGMLIFSLLCILFIGPVESANRVLDSVEKKYFSKKLGIGAIEILIISILLQVLKKEAILF